MVVGKNKLATTLIAMRMRRYNKGRITPIEHVQGFTRSHWMPSSGECLGRTAPAAAMINEFVETTQITNKTQLLASNYGTMSASCFLRISYSKTNPLLSSSMQPASFKCEMSRLELKSLLSFLSIKHKN
jgi:hypothetical protein